MMKKMTMFRMNRLTVRLTAVAVAASFMMTSITVEAASLDDTVLEAEELTAGKETVEEAAETCSTSEEVENQETSIEEPASGEIVAVVITEATGTDEKADENATDEEMTAEDSAVVPDAVAAGEDSGDDGDGDDTSVKASDMVVTITDTADGGGSDTYRKFTFYNNNDENKTTYTCYVYGDGVTDAKCSEFAAAYLNTGSGSQAVKDEAFSDSNKSSVNNDYNEGYDSNHCWLKAEADALYNAGWMQVADAGIFNVDGSAAIYFQDEDQIGDYLSYCFEDEGGFMRDIIGWLDSGNAGECSDFLKYGEDSNDALLSAYAQELVYGYDWVACLANVDPLATALSWVDGPIDEDWTGHNAATMDIYFYVENKMRGAHAVGLTGYITDADGTPVGLIITDPDDSVETGSDDPSKKDKIYQVNNLVPLYDGCTVYNMYSYYNNSRIITRVTDLVILPQIGNFEKIGQSLAPSSTRAIKNSLSTETTYNISDYLNVGLNYDFLNYYDIVSLKYDLYDTDGNKVSADGSSFTYSKETWQELLESTDDFTLDFSDIINTYGDGSYELKLSVDKDCFYGNYGWFAEKYNNGEGYLDILADVWINLIRRIIQTETDEESDNSADDNSEYYEALNQLMDQIIKKVDVEYSDAGSFAEVTTTATLTDRSEAATNTDLRNMVSDLMLANNGSQSMQAALKDAGISYSDLNSKKVSVLLSSAIQTVGRSTITLSGDNLWNLANAKLIAMVTTKDGKRVYVKGGFDRNGHIIFNIPENAASVLLVSFS